MLKQRVITAILLAGIVLGLLFFAPNWAFNTLLVVVFTLAAWEWGRLAGIQRGQLLYPVLLLGLTLALMYGIQTQIIAKTAPYFAAVVWWFLALSMVINYRAGPAWWGGIPIRALMGCAVLIPTALAIFSLRQAPLGPWLVLLLLGIVALMDTGAYFTGRALGRRKLAPFVSPGKSWEGVLGGLGLVVFAALLLSLWRNQRDVSMCLILFLPTAAVSVLGDLVESMVKRHQGVKDSSQLLPGHGGFMDRIDGITAAAPIFTLILLLTGWTL